MERRWLFFFLASFLVIQAFTIVMQKSRPRSTGGRAGSGITTGTVTASGELDTTGTPAVAGVPADEPAQAVVAEAARAPRRIENTSITIARNPGEITTATTDKYSVGIDSVGAVVNSWTLLDPGSQSFKRQLGTTEGIEMVRRIPGKPGEEAPNQTWPLQVSFQERGAYSYEDFNNVEWEARAPETAGEKRDAILQFLSPTIRGIRVAKTYTIPRDEYYSTVRVTLVNDTDSTVSINDDAGRGLTVRWGPGLVERILGAKGSGEEAYDAGVYRTEKGVVSAHSAPDKEPIEGEGRIEWAGVESKFFAALLVTDQPDDAARQNHFYFRSLVPTSHNPHIKGFIPPLTMELATTKLELPARGQRSVDFGLYIGPKKYGILKQYKHHLQTLMFHTSWPFMRAIYLFLTDLLNWIFNFVRNYGIAIIILTVLVRLATFPLTQHSIRIQAKTMAEQSKVKPFIDAINEKYKNDPQEKNKQVWKVYQEHGISPFGALRGCVPMLLQLPVFYGLYRVSNDTIDLQGAHFLWIRDLSLPDHLLAFGIAVPLFGWTHLNILPVLMGFTQMIATKVASSRIKVQDPTQKQIMYMMPVMMTVMLYNMPAGLMLYWNASNVWQIFQTLITNRQMKREELKREQAGAVGITAAPPPPAPKDKPRKKKR